MQYYISGPPMNPLARILAALVGVLALVGAFFFGIFIFVVAIALGLYTASHIAEIFVADLFTPAGHIRFRSRITGPNLQYFTDFYTANAFFGLQQWTRASHCPGIYNLCRCYSR